jgi:heat shock protein HslJ
MKKMPIALASLACALALALALALAAPADAKKGATPAGEQGQQQQDKNAENGGIPRYKPFPYGPTYVLKDINGKTPPVEIWIRFDSTGRANGNSGCKNWSGVFIVGPDRLGPRAMPALNEQKCDGSLQALEHDYWGILLNGPYWDTQGDDLILKGFKGGSMRFYRSL